MPGRGRGGDGRLVAVGAVDAVGSAVGAVHLLGLLECLEGTDVLIDEAALLELLEGEVVGTVDLAEAVLRTSAGSQEGQLTAAPHEQSKPWAMSHSVLG